MSNADLAPTFAEWAGTRMPAAADGRSFAPLLGSGGSGGRQRQAEPIGYVHSATADADKFPTWRGVKTRRYTYVEYADGERELYDDRADPFQLTNIAGRAEPALLRALARRTAALAACDGAACRKLENAPVPQTGTGGGRPSRRPPRSDRGQDRPEGPERPNRR